MAVPLEPMVYGTDIGRKVLQVLFPGRRDNDELSSTFNSVKSTTDGSPFDLSVVGKPSFVYLF